MTRHLALDSVEATLALGRRLGAAARAGDVILLTGPLGAGKTVLVRGLAEGLDSPDEVASPTFVLVRHYRGRLPLYHADLYRLDDPADADRLGLLQLAEDGLLVVEWAERAPALAVVDALRLSLGPGADERARQAVVEQAPAHLGAAIPPGAAG